MAFKPLHKRQFTIIQWRQIPPFWRKYKSHEPVSRYGAIISLAKIFPALIASPGLKIEFAPHHESSLIVNLITFPKNKYDGLFRGKINGI